MKYLLFLSLISSPLAHSESTDQWTCTDEATTRRDMTWVACGIGEGMDEGAARERALQHALDEFKDMCELNTGCQKADKHVEPKRTTCSMARGWWKCYRMVQITLY